MSLRGDHQCRGSGATFERVMSSAVSLELEADIHYQKKQSFSHQAKLLSRNCQSVDFKVVWVTRIPADSKQLFVDLIEDDDDAVEPIFKSTD